MFSEWLKKTKKRLGSFKHTDLVLTWIMFTFNLTWNYYYWWLLCVLTPTWVRSTCRGWPGSRWRRRRRSWRWCTRRRGRRTRACGSAAARCTAWRAARIPAGSPPAGGATRCLYLAAIQRAVKLRQNWLEKQFVAKQQLSQNQSVVQHK